MSDKAKGDDDGKKVMKPLVRIGTRGSPLALAQAYETKRRLAEAFPDELADESAVDTARPLTEIGLDSLMAVRMRNTIRGDFGVEPPVALLLQGANLADVALDLIRQLGLEEQESAERPNALRDRAQQRAAARQRAASRRKVGPRS